MLLAEAYLDNEANHLIQVLLLEKYLTTFFLLVRVINEIYAYEGLNRVGSQESLGLFVSQIKNCPPLPRR